MASAVAGQCECPFLHLIRGINKTDLFISVALRVHICGHLRFVESVVLSVHFPGAPR